MKKQNGKTKKMAAALRELGRIAGVLIDGEEACSIITARAWQHIAHPDPKHRFMAGDYYDVEFDRFLRLKKLLMRLEKLVDFPCDSTVWLKVPDTADQVTPVVHNGTLSRWYQFGKSSVPIEGPLAACLAAGEIVVLEPDEASETVTVLSPLRDSLGDIVGLVEISALHPSARKLAPVWN